MKKFLFLSVLVCLITACTTPEEDAQIRLFWMEQIFHLRPHPSAPDVLPPQPFPAVPDEERPQQTELAQEEDLPSAEQNSSQTVLNEQPSQETTADAAPVEQDSSTQEPQEATTTTGTDTPQEATTPKPKTPLPVESQFLEITLEGSTPSTEQLQGNAPLRERQAMQRAIERIKQANQQTVKDIGTMFDDNTQAQALTIVAKTENILLQTANTSSTYQNYLSVQQKVMKEQEQQLNKLMRANASKIRQLRR